MIIKLVSSETEKRPISSLTPGDTFYIGEIEYQDNEEYIRNKTSSGLFILTNAISNGVIPKHICVRLYDGKYLTIDDNAVVIPVETFVTVDPAFIKVNQNKVFTMN